MPQRIGPVRIKAIALRKSDPHLTLEAIAIKCGVTKQRIYKIFKDEGIKKFSKAFPSCKTCGIMLDSYSAKFCNERCKTNKYFVKRPCSACGKSITMRRYILKYKLSQEQYNFYCTRTCYNRRNAHRSQ